MIILFRVVTLDQLFFENWTQWWMADLNCTPKLKYFMLLCCKIWDIFSIYNPSRKLDEFTKMINMFRVGTPQIFLLKNWSQWCMAGLNFTPHFKYSTIICCQNRYIFIIYRPTRDISVQKMINMFRVGIQPPFFQNHKNSKNRKSKNG